MKKLMLVVMLVIYLMVFFVGCSSGISQEAYDAVVSERDALEAQLENISVDTSEVPVDTSEVPVFETDANVIQGNTDEFDESKVLEQISIEEFTYSPGGWYYAFLILKNNSAFNISVSANVDFFDAKENLIGTENAEQEAFEAGSEIIMYFMPDEDFKRIEYELSVSEEDWYKCVRSDLSYETTDAKNKTILSVTNNGDEPADFVQGSVLFFKGDSVVGFGQAYFTDDDFELKSGKTIKKEIDCYDKFDSYKVFLTGRR